MNDICETDIQNILTKGGRELCKAGLTPGTAPTQNGACKEAARVIGSAIDRGMPHNPPVTGIRKTELTDHEIDQIYSEKQDAGLVDVKFVHKNLDQGTPIQVMSELVSIHEAIADGHVRSLDFGDLSFKLA